MGGMLTSQSSIFRSRYEDLMQEKDGGGFNGLEKGEAAGRKDNGKDGKAILDKDNGKDRKANGQAVTLEKEGGKNNKSEEVKKTKSALPSNGHQKGLKNDNNMVLNTQQSATQQNTHHLNIVRTTNPRDTIQDVPEHMVLQNLQLQNPQLQNQPLVQNSSPSNSPLTENCEKKNLKRDFLSSILSSGSQISLDTGTGIHG